MHPRWPSLLAWLRNQPIVQPRTTTDGAGYGLFALGDIAPSTPLFTVPGSALLNALTLAIHYPDSDPPLTSTQIVALHLFLHRPTSTASLDPLFGPYIAILPQSFDAHPLVWLVNRQYRPSGEFKASLESHLLSLLPPFVTRDLERVATTFNTDWKRIVHYLTEHPNVLAQATNSSLLSTFGSDPAAALWDFLWAWLNVNTRCIYYRVKSTKSDPDNLTLCPILDFANHSMTQPSTLPEISKCDLWDIAPRPGKGDDFTLLSPPDVTIHEGQELFLRYGYHSNQFLFVEYGFVNPFPSDISCDGFGDVDISPLVEQLFLARGTIGKWMKSILEDEGYWDSWTMHISPAPAHPDYRLITALRLYHILPSDASEVPDQDYPGLVEWREIIYGTRDSISEDNENQWKQTLLEVCHGMVERANYRIETIPAASENVDVPPWKSYMETCIQTLWKEERMVAQALVHSIEEGVEF